MPAEFQGSAPFATFLFTERPLLRRIAGHGDDKRSEKTRLSASFKQTKSDIEPLIGPENPRDADSGS